MFKLVTLAALIAIAAADVSHIYNPHSSFGSPHSAHYNPLPPPPPVHHQSYSGGSGAEIPILRHESNIQEDGSYQYAYETGNGIAAQESGSVPDGTVAQGSYSFTSPEGEQVQVQYVADTNGFQPSGSHVPEIPAAIQRSLAWNAAHPEQPHAQNYGQVPHRRF